MKLSLLALALAVPAAASPTLELARARAEQGFAQAFLTVKEALQPRFEEPVLQALLQPRPFQPTRRGPEAARVKLAAQFERHLDLMTRRLGARDWKVGGASDAGFKTFYFAFTAGGTSLAPVGEVNRLRGKGIDARVDEKTVYNLKVQANIFNPVRGSTLIMTPVAGTSGPTHKMKTGEVLDAAKAKAAIAVVEGVEYWIYYGRDVKPDGSGFGDSRSFLFVHENGLSSKAWPLAESSLPLDTPAIVDMNGKKVALTRTSAGELVVAQAQ